MTQRELVNKQVAELFEIIFNRMTISDIETMLSMRKSALYASMNHGISTQLAIDNVSTDIIKQSVQNIIDHDMNTIMKVLKESELLKVLDEKN